MINDQISGAKSTDSCLVRWVSEVSCFSLPMPNLEAIGQRINILKILEIPASTKTSSRGHVRIQENSAEKKYCP